jgi:hypothetical protein
MQAIQDYLSRTRYFDDVPILTEEQLQGEDLNWARFAYGLTRGEAGRQLYAKVCGSSGFENVEPVAILFTDRNAFVLVNFRWSSTSPRFGTGQTLVAFELSRKLREFKEVHMIFDLSQVSTSTREIYSGAAPLIAEALRLAVGQ